jgi:group I intron endonuclease
MINGKIYIGQTIENPKIRHNRHKYKSKKPEFPINFAIAKYGFDNFKFEVIAFAKDQKSLNDAEIFYIKIYKSSDRNIGYNLDLGGAHGKHSAETKAKISASNMGRKNSDESNKRISASKMGSVPWNKGVKGKQVAWNVGIPATEEHKEKNRISHTGKKHSASHIEKNRTSHMGKTLGDKNGNVAISDANLILLLEDLKSGNYKQYILAEKYNISSATISRIKRKGKR